MKTVLILITLIQLLSITSDAKPPDLQLIIKNVQNKYESINDFHAEFEQQTKVNTLNSVQKSNGEVHFKKPGMMRWNYYNPTKDEIVSNGKTIWYYNDTEKQIIESPLASSTSDSNSTTLLTGLGNLNNIFNSKFSSASPTDKEGNYLIDLTPKNQEEEEFNKVTIIVDKNNYTVNKFYIYDLFGNKTTIKLKNLKLNKNIPSSIFELKKPQEVEVVKIPPT